MSVCLAKPMFIWTGFNESQPNYSSLINALRGATGGGYWLSIGDISLLSKEYLSVLGEIVN